MASLYFCLCSPTQRITCKKRRWTSLYVSSRATVLEKHEFWIGCISDVKYEIKMSRDHVLTVMSSNNSLYSIPNLKFVFLLFLFFVLLSVPKVSKLRSQFYHICTKLLLLFFIFIFKFHNYKGRWKLGL